MADTENPLPNIETVMRFANAKRRSAMQKMQQSEHYARRSAELKSEAAAELQEVEAFERLPKSMPQTPEDLARMEHDVNVWHAITPRTQGTTLYFTTGRQRFAGGEAVDTLAFRTQRDQVGAHCFQILSDGSRRTTEDLLDELTKRGVQLTAANKLQRLSQLLSMNSDFRNERGRGWSLAVSPAIHGEVLRKSNEQSELEKDPVLVARAKQLARDDGNSAR